MAVRRRLDGSAPNESDFLGGGPQGLPIRPGSFPPAGGPGGGSGPFGGDETGAPPREGGEGGSRGSETPRERPRQGMPPPSLPPEVPPQGPKEPTPMAGTPGAGVMPQPPPPAMQPFQPMPSAGADALISAPNVSRRLYGGSRGLLGGGLGETLDPTSNDQSDPISSLIQTLMAKKHGGFGSF